MNQLVTECAAGDTSIRILAADGTSYTTLALLLAAGKQPWPALDPGMNSLGRLSVRTIDSGGESTNSDFYYLINKTKPAATSNMVHVSGSGQERQIGNNNATGNALLSVWQLWFALTASTDSFEAVYEY